MIKRDKNIGNFSVRSAFQTSEQPGTFKEARKGFFFVDVVFAKRLKITKKDI